MRERLSRALRLPTARTDSPERNPELEERVEAVIAKVDSLEARVEDLEQQASPSKPNDAA